MQVCREAYHAAGHCVGAWAVGYKVEHAAISLGSFPPATCSWAPPAPPQNARGPLLYALTQLIPEFAGIVAEMSAGFPVSDRSLYDEPELDVFAVGGKRTRTLYDVIVEDPVQKTQRLLSQHWPALQDIA